MKTEFGPEYAAAYDALYADKDYTAECDLVESAFARYADAPPRSVLDVGCGTGGHAVLLAKRGYSMTGVDVSPEMLARAREKAAAEAVDIRCLEGDARSVDVGADFDAVLLMFAVLSYQLTNDDVLAALRTARRHLRRGGTLLLDAWYGPGVLTDPPQRRDKTVSANGTQLRRVAEPELDVRTHSCRVSYELYRGDEIAAREVHTVRFFFPLELELFLRLAGFDLRNLSRFGDLDAEPSPDTWSVFVAAAAV